MECLRSVVGSMSGQPRDNLGTMSGQCRDNLCVFIVKMDSFDSVFVLKIRDIIPYRSVTNITFFLLINAGFCDFLLVNFRWNFNLNNKDFCTLRILDPKKYF